MGHRRARVRAVLWSAVVLLAPFLAAPAAHAALGINPMPSLPSVISVGDSVQGAIIISNSSTGTEGTAPLLVSNITLVLACGSTVGECQAVDAGVFSVAAAATGSVGCPTSFSVAQSSPGTFLFSPSVPVSLMGQPCVMGFTATMLRSPAVDVAPGTAGVQTRVVVASTGSNQFGSIRNNGSVVVTANRGNASLVTQASTNSAAVAPGTAVSDQAAVTPPGGGAAPTGTVTYTLVGPNPDAGCTAPIVGAPNTQPVGNASALFAPAIPGVYNFVATYSGDANYNAITAPAGCGVAAERFGVAAPGGAYTALTPARIEDSRFGIGALSGPLGPGATAQVQVAGRGGVPASGATAVVLNVTVTQPTSDGWLTLFPAGNALPNASNLNFSPGKTVANLAVVRLGTGGKVAVFNSQGSTQVILDVEGYYSDAGAGNTGRFQDVPPARLADSRTGAGGAVRLGPGASLDVAVAGAGGVPATGAQAAVLDVVATSATAFSFFTVYPTGVARPDTSNLNFSAGDTAANRVMTKVGAGGKVTIYNASGSTDVIVDVGGWYADASATGTLATFQPLDPARILDTRSGLGGVAALGAGGTVDVQVAGVDGVPASGVRAVILNATVTQPAAPGFLTIYPAGTGRPNASDLNFAAGETRPNLVVVEVLAGGKVTVFSSAQTQLVFDVAGYFT